MAPQDLVIELRALRDLFQRVSEGQVEPGIFAENLSNTISNVARRRDKNECEDLLLFVVSTFKTPGGLPIMDNIIFEIFTPLLQCSDILPSPRRGMPIFEELIEIIAWECTPREVIALFLAALDDRPWDGRPSWRTSDNILLSKLTSVLDRLQRCQCQMLADCLLLLLKLARHFILPPATRSSESVRKARSPTAGASGDCHDEQTQQDSQACSEQQRAVSSAAQARQQHFIGKGLEAFACDLPCLIISSWRQASAQQLTGSKMVHAFLTRCYAYFSEISFKAETAILSQLEPHQRHAIFGADAPAKEWANPMQVCLWTLQDAAASNAKWAAQNSVDLEAEPEEKEARALWQADEVALGRHLLVHAEMVLSSNEARPSDPATLLSRAAHSVPFLLNTAGQRMSEVLAMKALQLAAAAAAHAAARAAPVGVEFGDDVQRLLQVLATTMAANPLPAVRNAAHYAADALLTSLTLKARLQGIDGLFKEGHPGVSALLIRRVAHDAQALWPTPEEAQSWHAAVPEPKALGPRWAQLEPALMPLIHAWLAPHGSYGWRDSLGALHNAEPICAALNLYMLLFLRAAKIPGFMPGMLEMKALKATMDECFTPLRAAALRSQAELQETGGMGIADITDSMLGLERVLCALHWAMEAGENMERVLKRRTKSSIF